MRLFIAALLPEEIKKQLTESINSLKHEVDGVKWERPEKLHITLKFLGDVEESKLDSIDDLLIKLSSAYSSFNLSLTDFGGFPNLKKPRILYVGLSTNSLLSKLVSELEEELSVLGFEKESRKFIPHITLGRVKKKINIQYSPQITKNSFKVTQIGLIKSKLSSSGSVYKPKQIFRLVK